MTKRKNTQQQDEEDDLEHYHAHILHSQIPDQITTACARLLMYDAHRALQDRTVVARLVQLLQHDSESVRAEVARTIALLMSREGEQVVRLFYAHCIVPAVLSLIDEQVQHYAKPAAEALLMIVWCVAEVVEASLKQINQSRIVDLVAMSMDPVPLTCLLTLTEDNAHLCAKALPLVPQLKANSDAVSLGILCNIQPEDASVIVRTFESLCTALAMDKQEDLGILFPAAINLLQSPAEKPIEPLLAELASLLIQRHSDEAYDCLANLALEFPSSVVTDELLAHCTRQRAPNCLPYCRLIRAVATVTESDELIDSIRPEVTDPECLDILADQPPLLPQ